MLIRRFWLDANGGPHVEEVTLYPATDPEAAAVVPVGPFEIDGDQFDGPFQVVGLVDPAAGDDALAGQLHQVYAVELPQGVRLVSRPDYEAAVDQREARRAAELALVLEGDRDERKARETARASALAKLAESAGLSEAEVEALIGGQG